MPSVLGKAACFGKRCLIGQFCSQNPVLKGCRNCTDIDSWCRLNRTHMQLEYSSCYYICERQDKEEAVAKWLHAEETISTLHICLWTLIGLVFPFFLFFLFKCGRCLYKQCCRLPKYGTIFCSGRNTRQQKEEVPLYSSDGQVMTSPPELLPEDRSSVSLEEDQASDDPDDASPQLTDIPDPAHHPPEPSAPELEDDSSVTDQNGTDSYLVASSLEPGSLVPSEEDYFAQPIQIRDGICSPPALD